ncbi:hypothetical protein GUJ93_ZPchr0001g32704 [Zizania palustris]|uniref:Uncharacterized protein n=1 Tax=Zizania palustris TaxID=103762 RepID=A0A8J5V211_ZIZPA|nr:hypothetical protein GUJ93_ZPchr0001g32704 [Zizania palustris]
MGDDGGGDGAAASDSPAAGFSYFAVFHNYPLIAALLGFAVAQSISSSSPVLKLRYKENRWDPKQLIGSGGMPSSHSATVTALAVAIGFQDGFCSALFATAAIFASVVMYDASGIRLHAGKQAEVLNQIVCELPSEHPLSERRPLRELLGHTPTQVVAGALLGSMLATAGQIASSSRALFGYLPPVAHPTKQRRKLSEEPRADQRRIRAAIENKIPSLPLFIFSIADHCVVFFLAPSSNLGRCIIFRSLLMSDSRKGNITKSLCPKYSAFVQSNNDAP